jgi:lysophospholipase L1-like esterase
MARGQGRPPWWAVSVSGICCALLTGLVTAGVVGGRVPASAPVAESVGTATDLPVESPVVTFIGDSWTEGIGATALHGYADLAAEQLGWDHYVLGVGGSGYTQPGRGSTFDDRVERAVSTDPDVLVVQGSINDRRASPEDLKLAAFRTLGHLSSAIDADTTVLVLGASYTPGLDRPVVDRINDAVAAAAERAGFRFVDPAAAHWNDPGAVEIWADDAHPNDVGHQVLADRLIPLLESSLER